MDALTKLKEQFLSCNICTETLKSPCTLGCYHTFCRPCLTKYTKTRRDAITAKSILCPNCNQMTKVPRPKEPVDWWSGQFKPSFLIEGLLDSFAGQESSGYDPSGGYGGPPQQQFDGQQFIQDLMANMDMAVQYGSSWARQGKDMLNKNIEQYVATSKIKYYFAVDTAYVGKKLSLLAFPFTHSDWSMKYNQDEPIAPRYEVNAPDLYIPVMAFVTYILVAGLMLGTQNRFTPEQLGIQASSALVWFIIELLVVMLTLYIMNLKTDLKFLDIMSYLGYKFVGMIFSLLAGLVLQGMGYYSVLLYFSVTLAFFLVRTLRVQILPHSGDDRFSRRNKRSLYLILSIALCQPLLMWWLTSHIMFGRKIIPSL